MTYTGEPGRRDLEATPLTSHRTAGETGRDPTKELERFFSLSPDMLSVASFQGQFTRLNSAWSQTLGWTLDELMARPYLEFVHPDDASVTLQEIQLLARGIPILTFVNRYRTNQGTYRWLEWNAVPVVEEGLIYAAARDITEQRMASLDVQEAKEEAERANRAKNEFLSRMSHGLRTPLNAVLGFAQLLASEPLEAKQQDSVQQILKGGRHLLALINEVLDLARIESGRLALSTEPVDVGDVVQQAVDFVRPLADPRKVQLEVDEAVNAGTHVAADRQRLSQVLHNLLSNAIKYNRDNGRVTVSVEARSSVTTRINVSDTGAGIRPEKRERLFQPFERLGAEQTSTDGAGLGLVTARGLVQAMGGTMGVTSEVDAGSTFWLELPATDPPTRRLPQEASQRRLPPEQAATRGLVLYIEDNRSNRVLMEHVLGRRPGVRLASATDAAAGLSIARTERPDLILLDLHLPDLPGEEVLRLLWADPATRAIPVVVLSADASPGHVARLLAAGARAYLTKPLDVDGVLRLVDDTLGRTPRPGESTA